jgi:hypothetical protein
MKSMGMLLLIVGAVTAAIGLALLLAPKVPWLGHLPGDIHYPEVGCCTQPRTARIGMRGRRTTSAGRDPIKGDQSCVER